jgi:glycosyltransferase involved in cell wall biosynthesis
MSRSLATIIVVPCYNEAKRLDGAEFRRFAATQEGISFCFVNDGSTDETAAVLRDLCTTSPRFLMLDLPRNGGKAEAVRRGVLHALSLGPELVGYWDADLATPLEAIAPLVEVMRERPSLVIAMGARVQLLGRDIQRRELRHYIGRVMASLTAIALDVRVYDTQCGAKVMRADERIAAAFREPFHHRWLFDVELIARILQAARDLSPHLLINEVPLATWREIPGSKLRMRDGLSALVELYRIWRKREKAPAGAPATQEPIARACEPAR